MYALIIIVVLLI